MSKKPHRVIFALDKNNFTVQRVGLTGCQIIADFEHRLLCSAKCCEYADYDRNKLHAMRQLLGEMMTVVLERINENLAHTIRIRFDPKLWIVKFEVD